MIELKAIETHVSAIEKLYETLEELGKNLYIDAQKALPADVVAAVRAALERETKKVAQRILTTMLKAVDVADERDTLVCQDTGIPIFWITIGSGFPAIDGARMVEALEAGVARATREYPLRSSIVSPLTRHNNQTSTGQGVPVFHIEFNKEADYLEIVMMPKGSGSENMSFLKMLYAADGIAGVKKFVIDTILEAGGKPCPPTIIGVGVGGSSDLCMQLAKKATLRTLGQSNPDPEVAQLEADLFAAVNKLGIGPMGLGGDTTALALHVEYAWTHITLIPVAINMQCWRGERRRARIFPDGRIVISD